LSRKAHRKMNPSERRIAADRYRMAVVCRKGEESALTWGRAS
jgi:hypothetical protein